MKTVVLLGDGMGDFPIEEFGNKTPLQIANIPTMRKISANSVGTSDDICGGSITLITFGNMGDVPLIQITDSNFVSSSAVNRCLRYMRSTPS